MVLCLCLWPVSDHWLFSEDCSVQRFCSSPDGVMVCGNTDGREVYAVTHDIVPDKDWVMQFKVWKEQRSEEHIQTFVLCQFYSCVASDCSGLQRARASRRPAGSCSVFGGLWSDVEVPGAPVSAR